MFISAIFEKFLMNFLEFIYKVWFSVQNEEEEE